MITLVASLGAVIGTGTDVTTSALTTTGATLIVVSITHYNIVTGSGVLFTDSKGNTYIPLTLRDGGVAGHRQFYALNPTVGGGHTWTVTGAGCYSSLVIQAFAGVESYAGIETGASAATGVSPLATGSVTPTTPGALVVTTLGSWLAQTDTPPAGFTGLVTVPFVYPVNLQTSGAYLVQTTPAAINPQWSWTGRHGDGSGEGAVAAVVVFYPSAEVPPPIPSGTGGQVMVPSGRREKTVFTAVDTGVSSVGPEFACEGFPGARFWLNGETVGGSSTFKIQMKNPTGGVWIDIPGAVFPALTVSATSMITIYPKLIPIPNQDVNWVVGGGLRVVSTVTGGRLTATVAVQLIG